MSLDVGERGKVDNPDRYLLGFRETVTLALGFFPDSITREGLYKLYSKVHRHLSRLNVISFDLPEQRIFDAMLRKLHKNDLVEENYMEQNYGIGLTEAGEAAFEVIIANLQRHPDFSRITNVYEFYQNAPIKY